MKTTRALLLTTLALLLISSVAHAQTSNQDIVNLGDRISNANVREEIRFPKIEGFVPIKCDLHTHTVFSDGYLWPTARVDEAWIDGLDAIAITDHIEYRPFKDKVLGDLNEANKIATEHAKNRGIIVISGTEITRHKPLGHINALFIEDANAIAVEDELESIDKAVEQGAFIMWNHPGWPDNKSTLYPVHQKLIEEGKIHGIEVFNHFDYYPITFDWCNTYNLAYCGNSDVHGLIDVDYGDALRPMTVVYGKSKDMESIKEGLFKRRSFVYFAGQLAGDAELLTQVFKASMEVRKFDDSMLEVYNTSDVDYTLEKGTRTIILPAGKTVRFKATDGEYTVTNCHVGCQQNLVVEL